MSALIKSPAHDVSIGNAVVRSNHFANPNFETAGSTYARRINLVTNPNMVPGTATVDTRTNYFTNPSPTTLAAFSTAASATNTIMGGGGPLGDSPSLVRRTQTIENGSSGMDTANTYCVIPTVGTYAMSVYVRPSKDTSARITPIHAASAGQTIISNPLTPCPANVWTRLSAIVTVVTTGQLGFRVGTSDAGVWPVDSTFDLSGFLCEQASYIRPFFTGTTSAAGDYTYAWSGAQWTSISYERALSLPTYTKDNGTAKATLHSSTERAMYGTTSLKCISETNSNDVGFSFVIPMASVVSGKVYTIMYWVYSPTQRTATIDGSRQAEGNGRGSTVIPPNTWTRVRATFTANATATVSTHWVHHKGGPADYGQPIWVDGLTFYEGDVDLPFFDGETPDTTDIVYSWTGSTNSSTSVETVTRAASTNFTTGQTLAYLATDAQYGKVWRSLITTTGAYGINADIAGLTSGEPYTILMRVRASRTMQVKPRIYSVQVAGPNYVLPANEWVDVRATITPGSYNTFTGLVGPGLIGHLPGDTVDVAYILVTEGEYTGGFFDGSSTAADTFWNFYRWTGTANASTSEYMVRTFDGVPRIEPLLVLGHNSNWTSNNVVTDILGTSEPYVTLRTAGLREGDLAFLFDDEAKAQAAVQMHTQADKFVYTDTDHPYDSMTYVVADGDISIELSPETLTHWFVTVPYIEVG